MKKSLLTICILSVLAMTISSCNTYHSINSATKLSHLSANPFMQKVARSVMTNIYQDVIAKGVTSFKGKPRLLSTVSSLFNTPESVSTFKNMLSNNYGISKTAVESNYSKFNTVKDVIGFVGTNAKQFDFNSYSNKLF